MPLYLVTGAAGFIGSHVSRLLLASNAVVVGIDDLNDYYDVRIKTQRLNALKSQDGFEFFQTDIRNRAELEQLFQKYKFDGIINLAARAGVRYSMDFPDIYLETNAHGTLNILECMRLYGVKKMVLASTSSLYAGHPLPFTEDMPVNSPISSYAASKKAAELLSYSHHHLFDLDISVLRYFTVYGPAGRPDMCIFRFIKWIDEGSPVEIFGDGKQSRDFTYVDDIARGTVAALKPLGYEIINFGGGREPVDLLTIISQIESRLGKKAKLEFSPMHRADVMESSANISKAGDLLGWEPQTSVQEGVDQCLQWYEENRSWLRDVQL